MTADCKKPSRPDGAAASSSTAARSPVAELGMFRLDPPGHPARVAHRPQGGERADRPPVAAATPSDASSHAVGNQLLARARAR